MKECMNKKINESLIHLFIYVIIFLVGLNCNYVPVAQPKENAKIIIVIYIINVS